ncbi:MAG: hypothetical protein DCC74_09310 [Proteobacteria bacterium]|nr:MAG: hypothetical protein DCC74_09310 [Pseudomonadota bacterium]
MADGRRLAHSAGPGATGTTSIHTEVVRGRALFAPAGLAVAVAVPLMLLAPAMWNGYALLQYDTGGYLARWYEGYLVPSRSTVYGLYLHLGEDTHFRGTLLAQALAVLWLTHAVLRALKLGRPAQVATILAVLAATTALPVLTSLLLTDIFAGLAVLATYLLVVHSARFGAVETAALVVFIAFSAASHNATLGVVAGLCAVGLAARPWLRDRLSLGGLALGTLAVALGAAMLLAANVALSGRLAWTPGGSAIAFGRMLQDGLVARYLNDHCTQERLKLCPYRNELPRTADDFLWGDSMFNTLGRFDGLGDEMAYIARRALIAYPGAQTATALRATAQQLVMVATGEGSHNWIAHTWGIFERYLPQELPAMRAARQQHGAFDFTLVNKIHVPVALASMLALVGILAHAAWRRRIDDATLLAAAAALAILGNAFLCGALSGPHDRYGARMAWLATFAVLSVLALAIERGKASRAP